MKRTMVVLSAAALMLAGMPMLAQETGPVSEFHGYVRAGSGRSSQGGEQVAFGLAGVSKFRLGNEAENYGELEWDAKVYDQDSATFNVHTMAQFCNSFADGNYAQGTGPLNSPSNARDFDMAQYWVEGKGILGDSDALKDASLWIGRRYYNRNDVHIIDFFYWSNQGAGGGIENVNLGFGKFHYAYIQYDNANSSNTMAPVNTKNSSGVHAFRISDIKANPGGSFMVGLEYHEAKPYAGTITTSTGTTTYQSDSTNNNSGVAFNLMHIQSGVMGGENKLTFQYGTGAASQLTNGDNAGLASGSKMYRVVENLFVQPSTSFGMQAVALYQSAKSAAGQNSSWTSVGARPVFFVNKHFSVAVDFGTTRVTQDGQAAQTLNKETLALQWGPKPDFWSRPVLRLFVTNAQWNSAASTISMPGNGTFTGKTSGTTYGVQTEIWW